MRSSLLSGVVVVVVAALALASCCTDRHIKVSAREFRQALTHANKKRPVRFIGVADERVFLYVTGVRSIFCRADDVWSVALDEFSEADSEQLRRGENPWLLPSPRQPTR